MIPSVYLVRTRTKDRSIHVRHKNSLGKREAESGMGDEKERIRRPGNVTEVTGYAHFD